MSCHLMPLPSPPSPPQELGIAVLLDAVWPIFDHDSSGAIDIDEFTRCVCACVYIYIYICA